MLEELQEAAAIIGLHMKDTKTQFATNEPNADETIVVRRPTMHKTQSYIYLYLGQSVTLGKQNQELEIDRRIRLGWSAYGSKYR